MLGARNILVPGNGFPHKVRGVGLVFGRLLGGTFVSGFPVGGGGLRGGCLLACKILGSIQVTGNIAARGKGFLHVLRGSGLVSGRLLGHTSVSDRPLDGGGLPGDALFARNIIGVQFNNIIFIGGLLRAGSILVCGSGFPHGLRGGCLVFGRLLGGTFVSNCPLCGGRLLGGGGLLAHKLLAI